MMVIRCGWSANTMCINDTKFCNKEHKMVGNVMNMLHMIGNVMDMLQHKT